ncbi:hypothetical protein Ocin01_08143 [Orchesella cincta]|uniref:Uncharacterized protein n=1 Tax=Orchesella cincta TaxID=48709 RepID=A0A1D2MZX1_ORCCI|nr:hypothetical protein Ocin01_08143 [Orchesella cincta]
MVPNPCCCGSLQRWTKAFAVIEAVWWGLNLVIFSTDFKLSLIVWIIFAVIRILLAVVLFVGALQKITALCWTWIGTSEVFLLFDIILLIVLLTTFNSNTDPGLIVLAVISAIYYLVTFYRIYVVYAFIIQLREETQQMNPEQEDSPAIDAEADSVVQHQTPATIIEGAVDARSYYAAEQTLERPQPRPPRHFTI